MDAIAVLKDDHRRVESLFTQFKETAPRAIKTRDRLVDRMIEQRSVHTVIEEQVFYPAVHQPHLRASAPSSSQGIQDLVTESAGRAVALKDRIVERQR